MDCHAGGPNPSRRPRLAPVQKPGESAPLLDKASKRRGYPPQPPGQRDRGPRPHHDRDGKGRPGSDPSRTPWGVVARRGKSTLPVASNDYRFQCLQGVVAWKSTATSCTSTAVRVGTLTIERAGCSARFERRMTPCSRSWPPRVLGSVEAHDESLGWRGRDARALRGQEWGAASGSGADVSEMTNRWGVWGDRKKCGCCSLALQLSFDLGHRSRTCAIETLFGDEDDKIVNPLGVKGLGGLGMVASRQPSRMPSSMQRETGEGPADHLRPSPQRESRGA
jgi:hypothetical protein